MRRIITALLAAGFAATTLPAAANTPLDWGASLSIAADDRLSTAAQQLLPYWRDHRLLWIGEMHGTRETPALVAALLRAQPRETPLLLGLEIPRQEHVSIEAFLRSEGTADARRALANSEFWGRGGQDGRSSTAMLDLLDAVRTLRASGMAIMVVCFDDPQAPADGFDRDARMAQALRAALDANPKHAALVLTGNYHARIARNTPANPRQELMASHLRDLDPLTINVTAPTGSHWGCNAFCGIQSFGNDRSSRTLTLTVDDKVDANGYRGTLTLPSLSASVPARSEPGDGWESANGHP